MNLDAAIVANEEQATAPHVYATEALRLSVRKAQLALIANPDPASPWWFLADPSVDFEPAPPTGHAAGIPHPVA